MQFGINSSGLASLPVSAGRAPLCESALGYINLDHAATTPALSVVKRAVAAVLPIFVDAAQPLVARLLGRPEPRSPRSAALAARLLTDRESRLGAPGMVRASFGLCTSEADIDGLCRAVAEIADHPQPSRARDERRGQRKLEVQRKVADVFAS